MSQYIVKPHGSVPYDVAVAAARITYHHPLYPYAREQFDEKTYVHLVAEDTAYDEALLAYHEDTLVGAMSFSRLMEDPHMPGTGVAVLYIVEHPDHKVAHLMYRCLIKQLKAVGAKWYLVSKRTSATTTTSEYRRVP